MSENHEIVMQAKHIVKQFPASHGRTLTACNDINLTMYKGRTLGIVGESGCGKSTFVRMVISLDQPTSGEILYHGKNITGLSKKETWENRQNLQMVFQDPLASFNPKMKIGDILTEPLMNYKKIKRSERNAKARELLRMVELPEDFVDRYPHNMSGGQRQRISIARALSLEPEILVCDEATSALDVSVQESVIELLVRLQKEKNICMIFICHDLALIRSFAHQIAVMYLGHIVETIPGEDMPYIRTQRHWLAHSSLCIWIRLRRLRVLRARLQALLMCRLAVPSRTAASIALRSARRKCRSLRKSHRDMK